jgi:hypothetical protein
MHQVTPWICSLSSNFSFLGKRWKSWSAARLTLAFTLWSTCHGLISSPCLTIIAFRFYLASWTLSRKFSLRTKRTE